MDHPIPDPGFMRKLKELDKKLGCKFNSDIERFVLTYEVPQGTPVTIMVIKGGEEGLGYFRQPDDRDITLLRKFDMENCTIKEYMQRIANYMEDYRRKKRKSSREEFRDRTKDDRIQLMTAFARPDCDKAGRGYFPPVKIKHKKGFKITDHRRVH